MKIDKQVVNYLEDKIRKQGAMEKLILDSAQAEISNRVKDTLCALFIDYWQYEPHYQHKNFSERRHHSVKRKTNTTLDRTGKPLCVWFLTMIYVCFVLNHAYNATIKNIPMNSAT